MFIKIGQYNGKPTLSLLRTENDRYPFTFGVPKAKLILKAFGHIKAFVEKYDRPVDDDAVIELKEAD